MGDDLTALVPFMKMSGFRRRDGDKRGLVMTTRRRLLAYFAALIANPAAAWSVRRPVERIGGMYLVDGWLLTENDLREIDRDAG